MTRKRHLSARTDAATRREIQQSDESIRALASRLGLDPKTVAKWRGRRTTEDTRKGPKHPVSTVLTRAEEALILIFRKRTLFTIDDCWPVLKKAMPRLSRSALHRCLVRYGVSRIPAGNTKNPGRSTDSAHYTVELYTLPVEMGGNYLLFAIGNLNGFVFARAVGGFSNYETADFLGELIKRSPVRIASIETSEHEAFTDAEGRPWDATYPLGKHPVRNACQEDGIAHIRSKSLAPIKVSRGWRGVASKSASIADRR
jgi:transposase-like protein